MLLLNAYLLLSSTRINPTSKYSDKANINILALQIQKLYAFVEVVWLPLSLVLEAG